MGTAVGWWHELIMRFQLAGMLKDVDCMMWSENAVRTVLDAQMALSDAQLISA